MRFSQRTNWNTEESELARAHRLRVEAGVPIADLTASNPTRCGFQYGDELLEALADPKALDYDPQPMGSNVARQAVSDYYSSLGVGVDSSQIVLTTSTSEAYSFLFRLLCDPGCEVLAPQPGYPLFDYLARLDDVVVKPVPLVYDQGWQIEPEGFRRAITPETRAIVLVHPNNPTGHFTKAWEAQELARMCREFNLSLIVDEVFLDYGISGAGRSFAGGLEVIADTFLSMNAPVQCALPVWLEGRTAIQTQIRARVAENLAELDRQLVLLPSVHRLEVEGGWYAVLRIPALAPDERTVLELLERGGWVHPGYFFGMEESGWLIVSLLGPAAEFRAGVTVLVNYLQTTQGSNMPEF